jgi:hypothetical protein
MYWGYLNHGQSGNKSLDPTDDSRREAAPPEPNNEFFETLREAHPDHPIFRDPVASKRLRDLLLDAQAARGTTPQEDARLEQRGKDSTHGPRWVREQNPEPEDDFFKGWKELADTRL